MSESGVRLLIAAVLLSAGLAGCGNANEGDKADAAAPQPKALQKPAQTAARQPAAKPGEFDASMKGTPAPALAFETADGKTFRLDAKRGTPTLVNLWATWCAPCIAEMPALDRLAKAEAGRLLVVGVSQDLQGWEKVRPFLKKAGLSTMTIALDGDGKLATALGVAGLPVTVLYDASGREVWRVNGPREWDKPGGFVAAGAETASAMRFHAVGQEPGWTLDLVPGGSIDVVADYGEKRARFAAPKSFDPAAATSIARSAGGRALSVSIERKACADAMSGKPYAYTVRMELDGKRYDGCGEVIG